MPEKLLHLHRFSHLRGLDRRQRPLQYNKGQSSSVDNIGLLRVAAGERAALEILLFKEDLL